MAALKGDPADGRSPGAPVDGRPRLALALLRLSQVVATVAAGGAPDASPSRGAPRSSTWSTSDPYRAPAGRLTHGPGSGDRPTGQLAFLRARFLGAVAAATASGSRVLAR